MRITERKEVVRTEVKEVTIGRKCNICGGPIKEVRNGDYNYFIITTHHYDWGNDSIESYQQYDACSTECALKFAKHYLDNAFKHHINTRTIEISHARSLDSRFSDDNNIWGRVLTDSELLNID